MVIAMLAVTIGLLSSNVVAALPGAKPRPKLPYKKSTRGALANHDALRARTAQKLEQHKRLNRGEKKEVARAELQTYKDMRRKGVDEISNTAEAAMLRNYRLRNKKRKGLIRKKEASLSQILFPGVSPEEYMPGERIWIYADLVESKKTQVPYEFYDLPGCPLPTETKLGRKIRQRKNLGARLQGHDMKPAPFDLVTGQNKPCTPMCLVKLEGKKLRWMRKVIERQYRVQLQLDSLPVLMRSRELNYAVRGYPVGFRSPPTGGSAAAGGKLSKNSKADVFLYNHLKFAITYHEDPNLFEGYRITGFDVHPVSITHEIPTSGAVTETTQLSTCSGMGVENDPSRYLSLSFKEGNSVDVVYSYDVQWIENDLNWAGTKRQFFFSVKLERWTRWCLFLSCTFCCWLMLSSHHTFVAITVDLSTLFPHDFFYN